MPDMKYILVTGGVISGVGKGVIASSFGTILKSCGIDVTSIKIDPYINIDAGTFSPYEHGEVYVLDDGGEVDLDLGNYERFLDITLHRDNNITTGKIYQQVIERERRGDYLGKTVQVIPHITDSIQEWVQRVAHIPVTSDGAPPRVCIIELGGTIGDIEGMSFVEAFRQFQFRVKKENFCCAHVSLIPMPKSTGEAKTKPTQSSVRELRGLGLSPDLILCRSEKPINQPVKEKISNFCHVGPEQVICIHDLTSVYHVPLLMEAQGVVQYLNERLQLNISMPRPSRFMRKWRNLAKRVDNLRKEVNIALVGKYTKLEDSYASVTKALQHACIATGCKLNLTYIEAVNLERQMKIDDPVSYHKAWQDLCKGDGVIVPGGFGQRGMEGKIEACQWCRETQKPMLGICLGLQASVIEFARNVLGLKGANSTEVNPKCEDKLVIDMPEHHPGNLGGTMRLGKRKTYLEPSLLTQLYKKDIIEERHRHRYEVNPEYIERLEAAGLRFVGKDETKTRMEVAIVESHPYYVSVQFHPEYLSRPLSPSPPFLGLILASLGKLRSYMSKGCRLSPRNQSDVSSDEEDLSMSSLSLADERTVIENGNGKVNASKEQRIQNLMSEVQLGDRKPSVFLRHLRSMAGTSPSDDGFIRELWMRQLPSEVQRILTAQRDLPLEKVAEIADAIVETPPSCSPSSLVNAVSSSSSELDDLKRQLEALTQRFDTFIGPSRSNSRSRFKNRSRFSSPSSNRICWYHKKFADKANKCMPPCNWKPVKI